MHPSQRGFPQSPQFMWIPNTFFHISICFIEIKTSWYFLLLVYFLKVFLFCMESKPREGRGMAVMSTAVFPISHSTGLICKVHPLNRWKKWFQYVQADTGISPESYQQVPAVSVGHKYVSLIARECLLPAEKEVLRKEDCEGRVGLRILTSGWYVSVGNLLTFG